MPRRSVRIASGFWKRDIAQRLLERVIELAEQAGLLSDEHFTVDGTLIQAWASLKSFRRKGETPEPPDDPAIRR